MKTKRKTSQSVRSPAPRLTRNRKVAGHRRPVHVKSEYDALAARLSELLAERAQYLKALRELLRRYLKIGRKEPLSAEIHPAGRHRLERAKEQLERLRQRLEMLQGQCDACRRAVGALMWEDIIEFDEEEVFANLGKRPSFTELIDELEAEFRNAV